MILPFMAISYVRLLDTIENSAIGISLCAEIGILLLHYRRLTLTVKLLTFILQCPEIPIHNRIFSNQPKNTYYQQKTDHHLFHTLNFALSRSIKLQFINPIIPSVSPWFINSPHVIFKLTKFPNTTLTFTKSPLLFLIPSSVAQMAPRSEYQQSEHSLISIVVWHPFLLPNYRPFPICLESIISLSLQLIPLPHHLRLPWQFLTRLGCHHSPNILHTQVSEPILFHFSVNSPIYERHFDF